ncbi:hypothetical protein SLE2022_133390 [Rubroshorea leprosula]
MANPRRNSYSNSLENPLQTQTSWSSFSSLIHFLKRPHAFPFLLSALLLLTWVFLRLQYSTSSHGFPRTHEKWTQDDDIKANLVRFKAGFPSSIAKDKRGWLLNPISLALDSGVKGGAVSCESLHVGEIRPGGVRGNHRHHTCNETFVIWGARTKFRVENRQIVDKGYAEVIIGDDAVAVAASTRGTAHALVNVDPLHSTFFIGCQDVTINYNSSNTDFNVWKDL